MLHSVYQASQCVFNEWLSEQGLEKSTQNFLYLLGEERVLQNSVSRQAAGCQM
jgi:hypothetical protein